MAVSGAPNGFARVALRSEGDQEDDVCHMMTESSLQQTGAGPNLDQDAESSSASDESCTKRDSASTCCRALSTNADGGQGTAQEAQEGIGMPSAPLEAYGAGECPVASTGFFCNGHWQIKRDSASHCYSSCAVTDRLSATAVPGAPNRSDRRALRHEGYREDEEAQEGIGIPSVPLEAYGAGESPAASTGFFREGHWHMKRDSASHYYSAPEQRSSSRVLACGDGTLAGSPPANSSSTRTKVVKLDRRCREQVRVAVWSFGRHRAEADVGTYLRRLQGPFAEQAALLGLRPGDRLLAIGSQDVSSLPEREVKDAWLRSQREGFLCLTLSEQLGVDR